MRHWLRLLAPLLIVLGLATPAVHAQPAPAEAEKTEQSAPALPYALLILYTLLVLTIVCMPSRKA